MSPALPDLIAAVRTACRLSRALERSCPDLTIPQYRLLARVASGDERATQLARHLAVAKPTVTAIVEGLVGRGLLQRAEVSGDRRAIRLALTPQGQEVLDRAERGMAAYLGDLLTYCEEPAGVIQSLSLLDRALEDRHQAAAGGHQAELAPTQ